MKLDWEELFSTKQVGSNNDIRERSSQTTNIVLKWEHTGATWNAEADAITEASERMLNFMVMTIMIYWSEVRYRSIICRSDDLIPCEPQQQDSLA